MIHSFLRSIHQELTEIISKNDRSQQTPTEPWSYTESCKVLTSYPLSVSKTVLLTELETQWRGEIRRGEHSGKLKQAIISQQLSLDTMLRGRLQRMDAHRCRFEDDGDTSVVADMIMHRQFNDFVAFARFSVKEFDLFHNRSAEFVQCRLLPYSSGTGPPVLLPSPLGMLHMDVVNNAGDTQFYKDILIQMHDWFRSSCDRGQENVNGVNTADAVTALRSSLSDITDPGAVTALFVEVIQIGEGRPHPSRQQSQYLVVRLRMLFTDRETHLILFDDQLRLASLWRAGMLLLLFRPYVVMNMDESLFGSCVTVAGPMTHSVVTRAAPELVHLSHHPNTVLPIHLLYGAVTVVATVSGIVENKPIASSSSMTVVEDTNRDQGSQLMRLLTVEWPATSSEGNEARNTPSSPTPKLCHGNKKPRIPLPHATMLLAKMGSPATIVKVAVHLLSSDNTQQHQLTSTLSTMRSGQLLLLTGLHTPSTGSSSSRGVTTVLREEDEATVERYLKHQQHGNSFSTDRDSSRLLPSDRVVPWLVLGNEAGSAEGSFSAAPSSSSKTTSASIVNISRLAVLTTSSSLFPRSTTTSGGSSSSVFDVSSTEGLMVVHGRFTQWRPTSTAIPSSSSSSSSRAGTSVGEDKDITIMATLESTTAPGSTLVCYLTAQTLIMSTAVSNLLSDPSCDPPTAVLVSCLLTRIDDVAPTLSHTLLSMLAPQDPVPGLRLQPIATAASLVPHVVHVYRVEVISDVPIQPITPTSSRPPL